MQPNHKPLPCPTLLAMTLATLLFAVLAESAWADRAPARPPRPAAQSVPLQVELNRGARVNRLVIPEKFLEGAADGTKVGAAQRSRTIVAGLALSAALASIVLVRKRGAAAKAVCLLAAGATLAVATSMASADLLPPKPNRTPPQPQGNVVIEVVDEGDSVRLITNGRGLGVDIRPSRGAPTGSAAPESAAPRR